MFAVIFVESRFNRDALSPKQAYGLMQMTMPAVIDAAQRCNLRVPMDMSHLFDSVTNVKFGSCYLKKVLDDADGDWTRALILYNGGLRQLRKYDAGDSIVTETANYVLQVERALRLCETMNPQP